MERLHFIFLRLTVVTGLRMSFVILKMSGSQTLQAHQFPPFLEGGKVVLLLFFLFCVYVHVQVYKLQSYIYIHI